jgi:hypothetical protein
LFADNSETQNEYIVGIIATSILIFGFFFVWAMFMCIFNCCLGKRRVGFLSGEPYDARTLKGEPNKRAVRGRIVFGGSGILFIAFTLLLVFLGIANLEDTANELSDGAEVSQNTVRYLILTAIYRESHCSSFIFHDFFLLGPLAKPSHLSEF